jgi:hypothetical protein
MSKSWYFKDELPQLMTKTFIVAIPHPEYIPTAKNSAVLAANGFGNSAFLLYS